MLVDTKHHQTVWFDEVEMRVGIIDQTCLPHRFVERWLGGLDDVCEAIAVMRVRGAPLIGVVAAYGVVLAMHEDASSAQLAHATERLLKTRPTAVNLRWALEQMARSLGDVDESEYLQTSIDHAARLWREDIASCGRIGDAGLTLLEKAWQQKSQQHADAQTLNILTHCNAGWLATVDWGTALAPIYKAHDAGIPVHVWVDETRPRNQGAQLTAWELGKHGVPYTLISDNTGGHLMQCGRVDLCIVGSDRTSAAGDVCNKIGTYLKALAARDNDLPFYVALPASTVDWRIQDGLKDIPIEQRDGREITEVQGQLPSGELATVSIAPSQAVAANYAFDVTPAALVTALITDQGVFPATESGMRALRDRLGDLPDS